MPASPIRKLAPLAYAAEDRGVKIYRLNIGQPDLPTPQKALDVLKHIDRKTQEYSPSQGYRSLREALVGYYNRYQIKLNADDIIVTCGGSEAVLFAFMSCLIPGDEIIVPVPMGAFYTVAKLPVEDTEDFCAWCLREFCWKDEYTPEGKIGETIMMAPAAGFYSTPGMGRDQVRLAYVLNKKDIQRALFLLEKALEMYKNKN